MNLEFENQGTSTFLVYQLDEKDVIDTLSLGMLTNNKIPGLAPVIFTQLDNTKYIKYNVSAKVPVQQLFSRAVNKKRLLGVFNGIVNAMLSAEEYMIDINSILVDLNYMFTDVTTCETILISLPIDSVAMTSTASDIGTLFKNIVFSTQFDQTENCDYVAKLINYLNGTSVFTLEGFKEILDSLGGIAPQQMAPAQPVQQPMQPQMAPQMPQQMAQPQVQQAAPVQPAMPPQQMTPPPVAKPVNVPNNKNAAPQQMNIPPKANVPAGQPVPPVPAVPANPADKGEKQMSMFSLLCHYNKENAELYKAQKQERKAAQAAKKAAGNPPAADNGFAVPNQPAGGNVGFAVPGMPQAAPAPMAMPGAKVPTPAPVQPPKAAPTPQPVQAPMQPQMPQAPKPMAVNAPVPQQAPMQKQPPVAVPTSAPVAPQMPQAPVQPAMPPQMPPMSQANFGETTVLGVSNNIGETTVLGLSAVNTEVKSYLIRTKNNEKILVDKPVFRIGKEKSYVDYFISDNTAISRSHANIVTKDGKYYIVDTNSTNHTYVNNTMLQSNVETELTSGTRIKLANEEFEFILA